MSVSGAITSKEHVLHRHSHLGKWKDSSQMKRWKDSSHVVVLYTSPINPLGATCAVRSLLRKWVRLSYMRVSEALSTSDTHAVHRPNHLRKGMIALRQVQ